MCELDLRVLLPHPRDHLTPEAAALQDIGLVHRAQAALPFAGQVESHLCHTFYLQHMYKGE